MPLRDKFLFERLKRKDKEAFIKAYDLHLDDIYRFIFFKVGSREEAEDLAAAVFLKTWDYIGNNEIKEHKSLKSFLYKVARNAVIDHYRKKCQENNLLRADENTAAAVPDERQDIHRQLEIREEYSFIAEKLFELKDEYREVITLKYINEMSVAEIARSLDKSRGNVRVLIFRALRALKEVAEEGRTDQKRDAAKKAGPRKK